MRDFFRSWRRKVGVVTLVMACVLMAGWVRSFTFVEGVAIPIGIKMSASLVSNDSSLVWLTQDGGDFLMFPHFTSRRFSEIDDRIFENPFFQWRWKWGGFGFGASVEGSKQIGNQMIVMAPGSLVVIPFWSIVISLTILAAFLLLSKPCSSNPKKTPEPIAEKVA